MVLPFAHNQQQGFELCGVGQGVGRGIAADVLKRLLHGFAAEQSLRIGQHSQIGLGEIKRALGVDKRLQR